MTNKDIALAFTAKWQAADADGLAALCTEDFLYSGPVPLPLSFKETAEMIVGLKEAAPDINYRHTYVEFENGHIVHMTSQISGTHTGKLDLTNFGMGIIPPSGKFFSMPMETAQVRIRGDKVSRYHVDPRPGGGISGMLVALGITEDQA